MIEHSQEIISALLWLIGSVGGSLVVLLVWIGKRIQHKVDELPAQVSAKVAKVHDELVAEMRTMNDTHARLERDVREQVTALDRRVVRLEVRCDMYHGGREPRKE